MADFVVDVPIAAAWCFKDEATPYTEAVLDAITGPATAAAPRLFFYETHNLTLMGLRRQRVSQGRRGFYQALAGPFDHHYRSPRL